MTHETYLDIVVPSSGRTHVHPPSWNTLRAPHEVIGVLAAPPKTPHEIPLSLPWTLGLEQKEKRGRNGAIRAFIAGFPTFGRVIRAPKSDSGHYSSPHVLPSRQCCA